MCDTVVALGCVTKDHNVYFGKNSDRDPNEAQYLEIIPGKRYPRGESVKCTYIKIPQTEKTNTILISRPFWMWGAEMGVNEYGVAIGNEAVFTKVKPNKEAGLIGMDFLRLALERSNSAEQALHVIIGLLETFGQGGNCGFDHQLFYDNSYLIADRRDAWILETAGRQWAAKRVEDFYAISNRITIGSEWDLASDELIQYAIDKNWCKNKADFHFADCYSDLIFSTFSQAEWRRSCSWNYLNKQSGQIDIEKMMQLMRMHQDQDEQWSPDRSLTSWTICCHKGFGPVRASQSVGSLICRLSNEGDLHFATGTAAPCISLFKPIWLQQSLPQIYGPEPGGQYDASSLWWQHELLHREVLKDFQKRSMLIKPERDELESGWVRSSLQTKISDKNRQKQISELAFKKSREWTEKWSDILRNREIAKKPLFYFSWEWKKNNRKAKMPL